VEIRIGIKPRPLALKYIRFQNIINTNFQPLLVRLYAAIASGIKKMNEPVSCAQNAATQVKNFGIRIESSVQKIGELFPAGKLKVFNRNAIKLVSCQRLKSLL